MNVDKPGTKLWRGICHSWKDVSSNLVWIIGDGWTIKVWKDNWVPNQGPLVEVIPHNQQHLTNDMCVTFLVDGNGQWDLRHISQFLSQDIVEQIQGLCPPFGSRGEDEISWKESPDGSFKMSLACKFFTNQDLVINSSNLFKKIWCWKGQERLCFLLWKVARRVLPTNVFKKHHHISLDDVCPICTTRAESLLHVLRKCTSVVSAWQKIINNQTPPSFWNDPVNDWVISNLNQSSVAKSDWSVLFSLTIDGVWRARNDFIFRNILPNVDKVVFTVSHLAQVQKESAYECSTLHTHRVVQ